MADPITVIQTAASVDFKPLVNAVLGILAAVVSAAIPVVVAAIYKRLGIANNADQSAKVVSAAQGAAGAAYSFALQHEGGLSNVNVHNAALAAGLNYFNTAVGPELTKMGITPERAASIVAARFGALLASDPTISAGKPAQIAAPAPAEPVAPFPPQHG